MVKANITINQNDFDLQIEPNTQIPIQNSNENNYPILDLNNEPTPEENVNDLNTGIDTDNISANLENDDDNLNDVVNNVGITNPNPSDNIDLMPIVIDEMPQNLQRPFLNIGKTAFTVQSTAFNNNSDAAVESSSLINPTSFSNIFNTASKPLIVENDAPGNELNNLDCGDIESLTSKSIAVNHDEENATVGVKDKGTIIKGSASFANFISMSVLLSYLFVIIN